MPKVHKKDMRKTASLVTRLREAAYKATIKKGPKCSVCSLSPEITTLLIDLRNEIPPVTYPAISKALMEEEKISISAHALSDHFLQHVK